MMRDTWHMLDVSYGAMCQLKSKSNKGLSGTLVGLCHSLRGLKSKDIDKRIREIRDNQWRGDMWQIRHPTRPIWTKFWWRKKNWREKKERGKREKKRR